VRRVKIADFKNNLSRHLAHVRAGGDLIVLDRDTPVARVVPFEPAPATGARATQTDAFWTAGRVAELEGRGALSRGRGGSAADWARKRRPVRLPAGSPSAVSLLLQSRRDSTR
jgi:antitoxin (DNA-binding transcriptional repressor) of toxin-antitoxin stability system